MKQFVYILKLNQIFSYLRGDIMKNYESPVLLDSMITLEGVYAASGSIPEEPSVPPETPTGGLNVRCEFRNHNSGSHSEVAIIVEPQNVSGECITMSFGIRDYRLDTVKDSSGYQVSNVSETGFTICRPGHFNATDRIEFNIQITIKDSPYHGSVGKTGQDIPCPIYLIGAVIS